MTSTDDAMLTKPDTQEAFALMLHDRLVAAEEYIADLQRNLDKRAPALPATTMTLDRVRKGVFFSFKAYKDLWPAVEDKDWNKQAALLMTEFQAFEMSPTLTLSVETIRNSVAGRNLSRSLDLDRLGHLPDAMPALPEEIPEYMLDRLFVRQYVVVEGVITSSNPCFCVEIAGACIERAWSSTWIPKSGIEEMIQPLARKSEWYMMALFEMRMDTRRVQELRYPDAWEHLMSVDGMAYYDAEGELVAEGGHVFRSAERDRMYRVAIEADDIRPDTRAVCKLIEELR